MTIAKGRIDTVLSRRTEGYSGQEVPYELPVTAYPSNSGFILVNSPGSGELKDGRYNRWANLARELQSRGMLSMVTYNVPRPDAQFVNPTEPYAYQNASWNRILVEGLAHVIDYALERRRQLCGSSNPIMYLSGFSSGGSAVGAVAFRYSEIKRILLNSTYDSVGDYFYAAIPQFTGRIYVAYGANDPLAKFLAYVLQFGASAAESLHVREVPDCDHRFRGPTNGKILSKAFLWAFGEDDTFPSPEGGLDIYEE